MKGGKMKKRFGFTLAEVLITLSIIGVIAAMTVPTLMSSTSEQEYKTGLKKAISTINQAITMQYALEGTTMEDYYFSSKVTNDRSATGGSGTMASPVFDTTEGIVGAVFMQRMQVVDATTKRVTDSRTGAVGSNAAIYLPDGMAIEFNPTYTKSGKCQNTEGCIGVIIVDVNGDKGKCVVETTTSLDAKNQVHPKDCFPLEVHRDGVRPGNFVAEQIMYNGK